MPKIPHTSEIRRMAAKDLARWRVKTKRWHEITYLRRELYDGRKCEQTYVTMYRIIN